MGEHTLKIENLSVNSFRQRCFVRRSKELFGSKYTFIDNLPEQIEKLKGFTNWENFSETWDIYWVGLDPKTMKWVAGRHNSPIRKIVTPLRIVEKDERTGRMLETYLDKQEISNIEVPKTNFPPETEEDRVISESLSGKVVVDETEHDKAIRAIEANLEMLQRQLLALKK